MYLLTAIPLCYLAGVLVISIIYTFEKHSGVYDGTAAPSLVGFVGQNILSVVAYALLSWIVSRFFQANKVSKSVM